MTEDSRNPRNAPTVECPENRRTPRFEADCFVAVTFNRQRIIASCVDYNEHGFGAIVEDEKLPVGEVLCVELPIAGGVPLKLQARVVHQAGSRHGFEFVAPDESKRKLIADFFHESAGTRYRSDACISIFGHVIRAGACIFCDWQPEESGKSK